MFGYNLSTIIITLLVIFISFKLYKTFTRGSSQGEPIKLEKGVDPNSQKYGKDSLQVKSNKGFEIEKEFGKQGIDKYTEFNNPQALDAYNHGVIFHEKTLYGDAIKEYELALTYNPPPTLRMMIYANLAIGIWLKNRFNERDGASISDQEYKEVKRVLSIYQEIVGLYQGLPEEGKASELATNIYNGTNNNLKAFALYGCAIRNRDGSFRLRK